MLVLFWRVILKYQGLALSTLIGLSLLTGIGIAQEREQYLSPDEPEVEETLNRELWEFVKGNSYETILPYLRRSQQLSQATIPTESRLPNGWKLNPAGKQFEVGNLPYEAVSYAGKIVILNTGFYDYNSAGQEVSILDPTKDKIIKTLRFKSLFPSGKVGLDGDLYLSGGFENKIYRLNSDFKLVREYPIKGYTAGIEPIDKNHLAVVTLVSKDDQKVYGKGQLAILNTETGVVEETTTVGNFPYAIQWLNQKLYLTVLGENKLAIYNAQLKPIKTINVGKNPQNLCSDRSRIYVVNTASDNLSVIDTKKDQVIGTVAVNYQNFRSGSSPTSCVVEGNRLYITQAELNAAAVIDRETWQKLGLIPTGWYPTKVLFHNQQMVAVSAKGIRTRRPNPNSRQPTDQDGANPEYVLALLKGSVSLIPQREIEANLSKWTQQVETGSPLYSVRDGIKLPIRHIFYIVKENRTYDQVLGDLSRGNGDPKLTLFGWNVTPNHHKIAEQFVTLDNFYANGEISVLGHSFTTSGYASPFLEWLGNARYSGRYNSYPFGIVPVTFSPTYLWNALEAKQIDYRIYGEPYYIFTRAYQLISDSYGADSELAQKFYRKTMQLAANTDRGKQLSQFFQSYYGQADTIEAVMHLLEKPEFVEVISQAFTGDSSLANALQKDQIFRRRFATFLFHYPFNYHTWDLSYSDLQRVKDWQVDFEKQVKSGKVAQLHYIWLPNDHTAGQQKDLPNPYQFVAQNDAALGLILQKISHSPIWKDSLILVVEDDAQNGPDHVDATRTVFLAAGPYVKRGAVISDRYDQLSLLRTIEILLGLSPLNQNDALAVPMFSIFQKQPNFTPYLSAAPAKYLMESDSKLYLKYRMNAPATFFDKILTNNS